MMKAHVLRITVGGAYAFVPAASAVHRSAAFPEGDTVLKRFLMLAGEKVEPLAAFLGSLEGLAGPLSTTGAMAWALGTGFIVVGAMWLGRSNLAPLH